MQEKTKPYDLYGYLQFIKDKLPMYIGSKSLKDLQIHIAGYQAAEWVNGRNRYPSDFSDFHDFAAKQYNLRSSGEGWPTMILEKIKEMRNGH